MYQIHYTSKFKKDFTIVSKRKYKLILEDEQGRQNKLPSEIRITVVENRAPDLKVAFPAKDLRVSSLQELLLSAEASDDYGLKELGLIYQLPNGQEESLKLLDFQLFYPHYRFIKNEENECRKVLFDFIPVEVWLDLV